MTVILNNEEIEVVLNYKKIKNIYFRWNDNSLVITCNKRLPLKEIEKLIYKNEKSLLKLRERTPKPSLNDGEIYYLGDKYKIEYKDEKTHIDGDKIITKDDVSLDKWLSNECKRIFTNRVNTIKAQFDDLPEFTLRIRKMTSRWGVCNKGSMTVTLNFDLIKKDITLLDYVIVHELCHFEFMDHSKKFWAKVEKYYPYHKLARKRLKEI